MNIKRLIFERGLKVGRGHNTISIPSSCDSLAGIAAYMCERFNVRPILLTESLHGWSDGLDERHLVLSADSKDLLNVRVTSLDLPQGMGEVKYVAMIRPMLNVRYVAGAMVHHCEQLTQRYAEICDSVFFTAVMASEVDICTYNYAPRPYYEFDALVTAARRTYDTLRYVLWSAFGRHTGSIPSNFPKTLENCSELPTQLRDELNHSWDVYGKKLTDYRDCIQHNVPATADLQTATCRRVDGDAWSVLLRIPDNPEAKSQRAFRFTKGLDALTYGWELANEVISIAEKVFKAIPTMHCNS